MAAALVGCSTGRGGVGRETVTYGAADAQFFELSRPQATGPVPVVVLLHGGFWRDEYDLDLMRAVVPDLVGRGWAVANVEYRRLGDDGGGWPGTFADVAAAIDHLSSLDGLDVSGVVAVGHSAGGHLAVWAAGRGVLPSGAIGAQPTLGLRGAVAQAGVLDLATAAEEHLGGGAVRALLGGGPETVPEVYRLASPIELLPIAVPVELLHDPDDPIVPFDQSQRFFDLAVSMGDRVRLTPVTGGHFDLIDPMSSAWTRTVDAIARLLG